MQDKASAGDQTDALLAKGRALLSDGRAEEALATFTHLLALAPDHLAGNTLAAGTLLKLARAIDALRHYEKALQINPECWEAHYGVGAVRYVDGKYADALAAYNEALRYQSDLAAIHCASGNALLQLCRPVDALGAFDTALAKNSLEARAHAGRGAALVHLDRFAEATEAYKRSLEIEPNLAGGHGGLGCIHLISANPNAAREAFSAALRLSPRAAKAHWSYGESLLMQGDAEAALKSFDDALGLDPSSEDAHAGRTRALACIGAPFADRMVSEALSADHAVEASASRAASGAMVLALRFAEGLSGRLLMEEFSAGRGKVSPSLDDLVAATKTQFLIYLLPSAIHPGAIMVGGGEATWLPLPGLTAAAIGQQRGKLMRAYDAWRTFDSASRFIPAAKSHDRSGDFARAVESCANWLWEAGIGAVVEAVERAKLERCAIVSGARLSPFPLAAARGPDGRYAIERLIFTEVTNGAAFIRGHRQLDHRPIAKAVILIPSSAPTGADFEARAFAASLPDGVAHIVDGGATTKAAFSEALASADLVYFAGHAEADLSDALAACLHLDDGAFPVAALFPPASVSATPRLVALAGCETGYVAASAPPAEPVGFPAVLNALGVPSVLSSRWLLLDRQTTSIMMAFNGHLLRAPADAPNALALAQRAAIECRFDEPGRPSHLQPSHPLCWSSLHMSGI